MGNVYVTSVADAIPFDPTLPNATPLHGAPLVYSSTGAIWKAGTTNFSAHAPTHLPSGSDPLTTAVPVSIGITTNKLGSAESFSKSDHEHNIDKLVYNIQSPNTGTTATTLNGTLTLTNTSKTVQYITGTQNGYSVVTPNATGLLIGQIFKIYNQNTYPVLVKDPGGNTLITIGVGSTAEGILQFNNTTNGTWLWVQNEIGTASGITNYKVTDTTPFTTSSATYVLINGMTVSPVAGTYAVWYNHALTQTSGNKTHWVSFFKDSSQVLDSERSQDSSSGKEQNEMILSVIQVNGSQAINVRAYSDTSITIAERTLLAIRLGA